MEPKTLLKNCYSNLKNFLKTGIILSTITLPGSIACQQPPSINLMDESRYKIRHDCEKNSVLIDLCDDAKECESMFGEKLTTPGYLPVFLLIKNKSDSSYFLRRERIKFTDSKGTEWEQLTGMEIAEVFSKRVIKDSRIQGGNEVALILSTIIYIDEQRRKSLDQKMMQDYEGRMIKTEEIQPASVHTGFVYFKNKKFYGTCTDETMRGFVENGELYVPLKDSEDKKSEDIEVLLQAD